MRHPPAAIDTDHYQLHEEEGHGGETKELPMAWKSRQGTAWLTVTIVLSLGLIGTEPSGSARESTPTPASTGWQEVPSQQNHAAIPLEGSPELWKFRRLTHR
jgi:hypothetical protein